MVDPTEPVLGLKMELHHLPSFSFRILLDRAHTDYDNIFHRLDPEVLDSPCFPSSPTPTAATLRSSTTDKLASTSETNTSDRSSTSFSNSSYFSSCPSSTDLSQILLNIKSCRWRHFRPRTLPLHELDNALPLFRRLSRGLKPPSRASGGGQPYGSQRPGRAIPAPSPVAGKFLQTDTLDILTTLMFFVVLKFHTLEWKPWT